MTILCPASAKELSIMLDWAVEQNPGGPVIIRYPKACCPAEHPAFTEPLVKGRGAWLSKTDASVCIVFTGSLYREALEAAGILKEQGIGADLYNLRFAKPVDQNYLESLLNEYKLTAFIEEGMKDGGFGEYAAALAKQRNCASLAVFLAADTGFLEADRALGTREELLAENGLDGKSIAEKILLHYNK
jgi:1-deoxy-D-xylulose-5-phosphate synthase